MLGHILGWSTRGLFCLSRLLNHRSDFERLVRDLVGAVAAAQVLWSGAQLTCVADGFTGCCLGGPHVGDSGRRWDGVVPCEDRDRRGRSENAGEADG
ncbi:hypothetical protein ACGFMM_24995 [Streptomyces sp. NPDC048604]|uniref:hypothetical protein n=1 Tax=Streptomyces sp. NPDC048604 TaxID=3365578 RepID=UPI00371E92B5